MSTKKSARMTETSQTTHAEGFKARTRKYFADMRYALHVITHPFDGFWDMAHEGKGNLAVATTFLAVFLITRVLKLLCTNFQFLDSAAQYINVFEEMASLLLPFLILCVANWAWTTLFDGKGTFKNIYIGMCYALVPYILIQLPMILLSNMITFEEAGFYSVLLSISIVWCLFLVFVGLMEIHDYGPGKTFGFLIFTVFGACVIIFLILVFFSLLSDAIGYFVSIYREIVFRLN